MPPHLAVLSPIAQVESIVDPVMVIHGANDPREREPASRDT